VFVLGQPEPHREPIPKGKKQKTNSWVKTPAGMPLYVYEQAH
jgi:hypothetical protein